VNAAGDLAMLARVVVSLVVVVLLVVLGARLARRTVLRGQGRTLRVLDRLPLSRESFLAVVQVADRGLVLGVSAQGVRVLTELDGESVAAAYPEPEAAPDAGRRPSVGPRTGRAALSRLHRPGLRPHPAGRRDRVAGVEVGPDGVKVTRVQDEPATPTTPGTGAVLDPRTWRQTVEALRDLTVRRG
jgi:flagellar biogenesis protein FliO